MGIIPEIVSSEYKRLFNETPMSMYIFDSEDYAFLAVNEAALAKYGYTREEFLKLKATDIRPASELERFYVVSKSIPGTYTDAGRFLHCKKNGEQFYVNIFSRSTVFEGRKARLVVSIDIDESVKTEVALQEAMDDITDILENTTDGFYAVNRDWKLTYINKEFEKILGHKRHEVIGKDLWEIFPIAKELKYYKEYHKVMDKRVSVHFEEYYPPHGLWTFVNAYPTRDGIAVYFIDITEQKKIQEELFSEQQNLLAVINNTENIIWSIDTDMNIISANRAFWERLETITGKSVDKIIEGDYEPGLFNVWQGYYKRAFKGEAYKTVWTGNYNGRTVYEEISFNPIYDKNKNVSGISCFSREITETYKYQRQIEDQNSRLKEIAWIQSHKVRAPVASLMGLLHLIDVEGDGITPATKEILVKIGEMATQFDEVIRQITVLAEGLEADKQDPYQDNTL